MSFSCRLLSVRLEVLRQSVKLAYFQVFQGVLQRIPPSAIWFEPNETVFFQQGWETHGLFYHCMG